MTETNSINQDYIHTQISEIKEWENREPSTTEKITDKIFTPITWTMQRIIPPKVIETAILGCNWMAEFLTDENDIIRDGEVSDIRELRNKDLMLSDNLANNVHNWAMGMALGEGGAAGALGFAGMAVDIPTIITLAYRTIHKIGLCYGYRCDTELDKQFIYGVMSAAGSNDQKEKYTALITLKQIGVMISRTTWKKMTEQAAQAQFSKEAFVIAIRNIAKQLSINLTKKKALQIVPFAGAVVGATMNTAFIREIGWAARRAFQRRWLTEQGLIL